MSDEFDIFWRAYPRRISKGAARDAFTKALRKTTLETMLAAIGEYIAHKPDRIDFKHPATWLNQECWDDEWTSVPRETGRRTFTDVAKDRFNGTASISRNDPHAGGIPAEVWESGSDGERIRIGSEWSGAASRH